MLIKRMNNSLHHIQSEALIVVEVNGGHKMRDCDACCAAKNMSREIEGVLERGRVDNCLNIVSPMRLHFTNIVMMSSII